MNQVEKKLVEAVKRRMKAEFARLAEDRFVEENQELLNEFMGAVEALKQFCIANANPDETPIVSDADLPKLVKAGRLAQRLIDIQTAAGCFRPQ